MPKTPTPPPLPKEALAYLRAKQLQPSWDYRDIWKQEHRLAFTVAKLMQQSLLRDVYTSLQTALEGGQTFNQWAENIRPQMQKAGWWGKAELPDPITGEVKEVELGSPRRLKTMYRTNLATARRAGQYQQIQATKAGLPYLLYRIGPAKEHRAEHVSWDGILLPVDDPWWNTHYPINDYGCHCGVRQVSNRQYQRYQKDGIPAGRGIPEYKNGIPTGKLIRQKRPPITTAPPIQYRKVVNKRTGEIESVPQGIGPGWDYHVGKGRQAQLNKRLKQSRKETQALAKKFKKN